MLSLRPLRRIVGSQSLAASRAISRGSRNPRCLSHSSAHFSTSIQRRNDNNQYYNLASPKTVIVKEEDDGETTTSPQTLPGRVEPRLSITFTCTVTDCGERSTHEFSKRAYTKGIVLVECPKCKNRHLIADNLGWFNELTEDGNLRTVEDIVRERGEVVKKGRVTVDGDVEYL